MEIFWNLKMNAEEKIICKIIGIKSWKRKRGENKKKTIKKGTLAIYMKNKDFTFQYPFFGRFFESCLLKKSSHTGTVIPHSILAGFGLNLF